MESLSIILTGANTGLGLQCAKKLCELGHDLVVSVRSKEKGEATVAAIKVETPDAKVIYFIMDMSDFKSIKEFVEQFHASGRKLDLLINNAGMFPPYRSNVRLIANNDAKMELTMTVNCLGTFLLTNLLLDDLKASPHASNSEAPSRIVNVSSMITIRPPKDAALHFDIDDFMLEKPGHYASGFQAYRNSKVALNLWSNELAKKLEGSGVRINTVCPGFIPSTDLGRMNTGFMTKIVMGIMDSFIGRKLVNTKPQEVGRDQILEVAFDPVIGKTSGKFYSDHKVATECPEVMNPEFQQKIWDVCCQYTGL